MRPIATTLAACALALTLSGCTVVRGEFQSSGGGLGTLADRTLPGATKELQLWRATAAYAIFSSIGSRLAADPDAIFALLRYMIAVRNDLDMLAGHLWAGPGAQGAVGAPCQAPPYGPGCAGYRAIFEADLPTLEGNLYKLAVIALPRDALRRVFNELLAQDWLGAARDLLQPGEDLVGAAHYGAATFRAEREVLAQLVQPPPAAGEARPDTVQGALAVLRTMERDGRPDPERYAAVAAVFRDMRAFEPLYALVRQSCRRMLARLSERDLRFGFSVATGAQPGGADSEGVKQAICGSFRLVPAPSP